MCGRGQTHSNLSKPAEIDAKGALEIENRPVHTRGESYRETACLACHVQAA